MRPLFACKLNNNDKSISVCFSMWVFDLVSAFLKFNYLRLPSWHKWQRSWFWFCDSWFRRRFHAADSWLQTYGPCCAHRSPSVEWNSVWMWPSHFLLALPAHLRWRWRISRIYHFDPKRSCWFHIRIACHWCCRCAVLVFPHFRWPIEHEDSIFPFRHASSAMKWH